MFNSNGAFIDSISYTIDEDEHQKIGSYGKVFPIVDRVNKRMLVSYGRQYRITESTIFEVFANEGGSLKTLSSIKVEGIDDHFRVRYGRMLENGDILMYLEQFEDPGGYPPKANLKWWCWILLDGSKLNIVSSTKDEANVSNQLILYPNPTTNNISIAKLDAPAAVTITNINGQVLKQLSNIEYEVNISDLPAGMYIFDITNKTISERHKVVKVRE
ncbi:MAG: T9SS type A sorting domain-containing protein [Chitinophagales bacterium]|nr:T9SS type A sorting domain-containing protein [Chitinophagales bacterium]